MNPNPTKNTNPQITDDDKNTAVFINSLVMSVLGYSVLDIPEDKRAEVISECVSAFTDYLVKFTEIKYGKTESIRLKAAQNFNDPNMFNKFGELGHIFEDAFRSFLTFLDRRWDDKAKKLQSES